MQYNIKEVYIIENKEKRERKVVEIIKKQLKNEHLQRIKLQ